MKYISINAPRQVEILEKPAPKPGNGEALLKMRYGGICGTDLNMYRGAFAYGAYPRVPGHEISAEIVEIGENDRGLKSGMLVTANPYFNCGKCYSCRRGLVNCCTSNETLGAQRDGAYLQYFTLPVERIYDGKGLSAKTLALIEPFCISYHGAKRGSIQAGDKVLVVGSGTIGILAAAAAKHLGAEVTVCDISEKRLKFALALGADGVIVNNGPEALAEGTVERTGGNGFDVVLEAVGLPSTFQDSLDSAAFGGRVVLIGISNRNLDFNFNIIQKKELNVFGSRNALREDFLELIDLVGRGTLKVDEIITHIYPFEKAGAALADLDRNQGDMLKVLLEF